MYHAQVLKQLDRMKAREDDEKAEYHRIRMEEKRQRDHQFAQIQDRRRKEKKKQKAIDAFIVHSIKVEQQKEKELNEDRRLKEKEIWRNILEQNEIKRKKQEAF